MTVHISTTVKDPDRIRERREQIIQAAVSLFTEKGFHRATTRELAKASGLSNGALYEYVESKEDILYLVCQHIHNEMELKLKDSLSVHHKAAERLRHALYSFYRTIRDMRDEVLLIYQESKNLPPEFLHEVLKHEEGIARLFEQILIEGREDGSLHIPAEAIPVMSQDIVVMGQMWAFRRWALQTLSFDDFAKQQIDLILRSCN